MILAVKSFRVDDANNWNLRAFPTAEISSLIELTIDNAMPTERKSTEMEDDAKHQ